ncbi:MAG: hypothetical protein HY544_04060 [Candidatus Diapherotrites archaeon]|uniref:Uncharacterized protein n=1 Tax=Candidatus Iainarchaeum sp. TaxID=3101447 RepID=A0A8T3YPI2_9ARCH|nr:hypothetical protein [Candidatus Diapherotrites archaeon]
MEFLKELKIVLPTVEEIIETVRSAENGEELTDRELWILKNFSEGGDWE